MLEGLTLNSEARLLLVDPHGAEVLEASDRLLGDGFRFRAVADRIRFLPQGAEEALANHRLRDVARDTLSFVDQQSEVIRQQRAGDPSDVRNEFRQLLQRAMSAGWVVTLAAAATAKRPSIELDVLEEAVERLGNSANQPLLKPQDLLVLACAMHSPDAEVAELARSRMRLVMTRACEWVSYRDPMGKWEVVRPAGKSLTINRQGVPPFFERQEASVHKILRELQMLAATACYHLSDGARATLGLVLEDLQLAHTFWGMAAASEHSAIVQRVVFGRNDVVDFATRDDVEIQNLASDAWSNGAFPRALSVGPQA